MRKPEQVNRSCSQKGRRMSDMFAVFAIGIVVGMSIIRFCDLVFKMREEDKRWKEIVKDWKKDR